MTQLREALRRWLRRDRNDSFRCPACETSIPPGASFCPHCYMVLRPEGMAALHRALQGEKVSDDIYILRKLHDSHGEDVIPLAQGPGRPSGSPAPPVAESAESPTRAPSARSEEDLALGLMTYALPASPPILAGPEDLPTLVRWFLNHDRLTPNNVEVLEEAHRTLYGVEMSWTYEQHHAWAIADDLHTYDFPDLLQEHLARLTTVYARTLQALRALGSRRPGLRSPADLPEPERRRMWELCLRLGLTATRVRVEGWIRQQQHGGTPGGPTVTSKSRTGEPPRTEYTSPHPAGAP